MYYIDILVNNVTVKVTIKSQKICLFCDFIVTNILVTYMIISNYLVTLNYIRKPVFIVTNCSASRHSILKGLKGCSSGCKISGYYYLVNTTGTPNTGVNKALCSSPRFSITYLMIRKRTAPALYPLYVCSMFGSCLVHIESGPFNDGEANDLFNDYFNY